jgi:hypothetical protein
MDKYKCAMINGLFVNGQCIPPANPLGSIDRNNTNVSTINLSSSGSTSSSQPVDSNESGRVVKTFFNIPKTLNNLYFFSFSSLDCKTS